MELFTIDERIQNTREHYGPVLQNPESIHESIDAGLARLVDAVARELEQAREQVAQLTDRNGALIRECHAIAKDRDAERELRRNLQMRVGL